jgi:hypothetical protein
MLIARGVIGGIFLFLGRELNFLFAGAMAAFLALRMTPLLPAAWPAWSEYAFILGLGALAAAVTLLREQAGYFVSGFLVGAAALVEYAQPGVLTLPLLPFLIGGTAGSLVLGFFTEWALIVISCLVGVYSVLNIFTLHPTAEKLVGAGLFIVGALTQAILKRGQSSD